jgi:hypothetical protein
MIIGQDGIGELEIILNFNNHIVNIPMKDRVSLNTQDTPFEVYLASNEPNSLVDQFLSSTNFLVA